MGTTKGMSMSILTKITNLIPAVRRKREAAAAKAKLYAELMERGRQERAKEAAARDAALHAAYSRPSRISRAMISRPLEERRAMYLVSPSPAPSPGGPDLFTSVLAMNMLNSSAHANHYSPPAPEPEFRSDGGGDFGGAGATSSWSCPAPSPSYESPSPSPSYDSGSSCSSSDSGSSSSSYSD